MVFVLDYRVSLTIFRRKIEGSRMIEVWPRLVLPVTHNGRLCIGQKVQVCMVSLLWHVVLRCLSMFTIIQGG